MAQRTGPVHIDDDYYDGDVTMLDIPQEAVGFVTGRAGNFLRSFDEEWCVLVFFCEVEKGAWRAKVSEELAMFSSVRVPFPKLSCYAG